MRVLLVMPLADRRGGAEATLLHLIAAGDPPGLEVTLVFLSDGPMVAEARARGVDARVLDAGRLRRADRYIVTVGRLARLARTTRAELFVSWMSWAHLYVGPAAALARVPAVFHQHGLPRSDDWRDVVATALPTRGVLVPSEMVARAQRRLRPSRAVRVVHPAVDIERLDPGRFGGRDAVRSSLGLPGGVPIVGMVARLQRWKGVHRVIAAMPAVLARYPDAVAVVVGGEDPGEPGYPAELERLARDLGIADHVRLVGRQDDVAPWLHAMDVVVHASDAEPFGLVVLEAMAMARPVVASDHGGPLEIIRPGVDGLLAAPDRPEEIASAIVDYLAGPELAARLAAAARDRALSFSTAAYPSAVAAALRTLAS
jgi:glycosyltransferase involved in cell wall biosynthesis